MCSSLLNHKTFFLDRDAFSSGQIGSKLWLCSELENLVGHNDRHTLDLDPHHIWILGGLYALTAFLLLVRERIKISSIRSFDQDPKASELADVFHENWVWERWKFKAFTKDILELNYDSEEYGPRPTLIINTSTEHMPNGNWFERIPRGATLALQATDMDASDHHRRVFSLEQMFSYFPMREIFFQGEKTFVYPDWSFKRFMMIGKK